MQKKGFYGWWVTAAMFVTFGLSVGLPYYNVPFFYDYFQKSFGWDRSQITLGFPIAAILTLWVGPLLIPKLSPRRSILIGTGCTALAFFGFSRMDGSLPVYYALWFLYTMGYILSGPIPHQVMVSHWFRKRRGLAMGIMYIGVAVGASLGTLMVKKLTAMTDFSYRAAGYWGDDVPGLAAGAVGAQGQAVRRGPIRGRRERTGAGS